MPARRIILGAVCALMLGIEPAAASAGPPDDEAFRVPRDEVVGRLRTVALAPLWVPEELIVDAVDRARLLELVQEELRAAGIAVIPPARTGPIVEEVRSTCGGYLDDHGNVDVVRYYAVQRDTAKALRERTGADGLLVVGLSATEAGVAEGRARWHGVEEDASVPAVRGRWRAPGGKLRALSVAVWLHGDGGQLLYANSGGLRLLFRFGRGQKTVPLLDADLLADDALNARAVRIALAPLLPLRPEDAAPAAPARSSP